LPTFAAATDAKVGKRASVDVLLGVSFEAMTAAGEPVWKSPNGVLLARYVPVAAIVTVEAATRRGREELTRVRRAFGLAE
jgi:putative RNA 2'-phosphotransferase